MLRHHEGMVPPEFVAHQGIAAGRGSDETHVILGLAIAVCAAGVHDFLRRANAYGI